MTRNYAEEDYLKKGVASFAVALGASEGDVVQVDADGNATLAASPFVVLGPYAVSHSDVDPVSWFDLGALDDGTIVWRVAVFVREQFTASGENLSVGLGITSGFGQLTLTKVGVNSGVENVSSPSDMAALEDPDTDYGFTPNSTVGLAQNGAHLIASDQVGGNTAGSVNIYALVTLPT